MAYEIESNKVKREVAETEVQIEIARKQKEIELAEQEAIRKEKELDATIRKQAEAEKYREEKEADAIKYKRIQEAEAEAKAIEMKSKAEAEAIRLKGEAEAEAMKKKAEAFKEYNDAAITQMIIEKLPEIAKAIAEPLSKTEKIVIVDNSGGKEGNKGASKITGYVTDIISQLPETVEALTGMNIKDFLPNSKSKPEGKLDDKKKRIKIK